MTWIASNGGQLIITPLDNPQKVLWSSLAGQNFIAAGRGEETVRESRGSYRIEDKLIASCTA